MILIATLSLLNVIISRAAARSMPILTRQANTTTGGNTFASITPSETLAWFPCYEDSLARQLGPISCARLIAPLDYSNSSAGQIQLAIIKLGASENGQSNRTVFVNPGGPGGDPIDLIKNEAAKLRAQVGNDMDIIGVVPRAVGSTFPPITCEATDAIAAQRTADILNALPGYTNASLGETYAAGEAIGLDCGLVTPNLIPYVGTVHVARDMDYVLQALGQDKLSYLGYSYGSVIGGTYAALFPDKIDRMVLDGVVDFNGQYSQNEYVPERLIGDADAGLSSFFQFCYDAGPLKCAFWYSSVTEIRDHFFEVDRKLLEKPLPIPGFGLFKIPTWRFGVFDALYRPALTFPVLAGVAAEIINGTAGSAIQTYLETLANATSSAEPPLVDPITGLKNSPNPLFTIGCGDRGPSVEELGPTELEAIFNKHLEASQFFGGVSATTEIICLGAALLAKERYTDKFENITTSTPILFVGNTADPFTPLRNAISMSEAFPGSGLLTINGTGHISWSANPTLECSTQWILPYFRDGILPPDGTVCDGNLDPFGLL